MVGGPSQERQAQSFQRIACPNAEARFPGNEIPKLATRIEGIQTEGQWSVVKIRLRETHAKILTDRSQFEASIDALTAAKEVPLGDRAGENKLVSTAIARTDAKGPCRALLHIYQEIHRIGPVALFGRQLNVLEIARSLKGITALLDLRAGKEFLLSRGDLSPNDLVPGLCVTSDLNPVEINWEPSGDQKSDIDLLLLGIDVGDGLHLRKGKPLVGIELRKSRDVSAEAAAPEDLPRGQLYFFEQRLCVIDQLPSDLHFPHPVLLSLIDADKDLDPVPTPHDHGLADFMVDVTIIVIMGR